MPDCDDPLLVLKELQGRHYVLEALRAVRENDITYREFIRLLADGNAFYCGEFFSREINTIMCCVDMLANIFSDPIPVPKIEIDNVDLITALLSKIEMIAQPCQHQQRG